MSTDRLCPHRWRSLARWNCTPALQLAHSLKATTRRGAAAPPWELIEQSGRRTATRCSVPLKLLRDRAPCVVASTRQRVCLRNAVKLRPLIVRRSLAG